MKNKGPHPLDFAAYTSKPGWIGIDLDGTLAEYDEWKGPGHIGAPIRPMVDFVRGLLLLEWEVRLVTARAGLTGNDLGQFIRAWRKWSLQHLGVYLEVTDRKDFKMFQIYDDRAVTVEHNTGRFMVHFT